MDVRLGGKPCVVEVVHVMDASVSGVAAECGDDENNELLLADD